jgi:hypothetical protein
MSQKTNAVAVRTIGIDTGKNTFHLIGLDEQGAMVLREKLARGRIGRRLANVSPCLMVAKDRGPSAERVAQGTGCVRARAIAALSAARSVSPSIIVNQLYASGLA